MTGYAIFSILKVVLAIYLMYVVWSVMTSLKRIANSLEQQDNESH
ncbi:hypothetical protein P3T73_13675 [Kiritimatiellota bacterium B12222]|nr:hypothetical protein P3T73_13675 [Kiritimatiellota bacterium B12222]